MNIISAREQPQYTGRIIAYLQQCWNEMPPILYSDCISHCVENHRGNNYAQMLIEKTKEDARKFGFRSLYLSTTHVGYYEKYGYQYIGDGYHPWDEQSRIYEIEL